LIAAAQSSKKSFSAARSIVFGILPQNSFGYNLATWNEKMTALLILWFCGLCVVGVVGVYYSSPPSGARPNVYEVTLWILSSAVLAVSVAVMVVSLVSPLPIQPGWWLP
jgi:cell division protein FtsW (lipid II flippase)